MEPHYNQQLGQYNHQRSKLQRDSWLVGVPDVRVGEEARVTERLEVGLHESSQVLDVGLLRLDQFEDHLKVDVSKHWAQCFKTYVVRNYVHLACQDIFEMIQKT